MSRYIEAVNEVRQLVDQNVLHRNRLNDQVWLSKEFLSRNRKIDPTILVQSIYQADFDKPLKDAPRQIVQGGRNGEPVDLEVGDTSIMVYAKSFPDDQIDLAQNEFKTNIIASERGIHTILPIALVTDEDGATLYTHYDHSFVPLVLHDISFKMRDNLAYSPRDFLADYLGAIARMHDRGLTHGDLHHGNIGQFSRGRRHSPRIGMMDFEESVVLSSELLEIKRLQYSRNNSDYVDFENFESAAIADVGKFTASLNNPLFNRQFPIGGRELVDLIVNGYMFARKYPVYPFEDDLDKRLQQHLMVFVK